MFKSHYWDLVCNQVLSRKKFVDLLADEIAVMEFSHKTIDLCSTQRRNATIRTPRVTFSGWGPLWPFLSLSGPPTSGGSRHLTQQPPRRYTTGSTDKMKCKGNIQIITQCLPAVIGSRRWKTRSNPCCTEARQATAASLRNESNYNHHLPTSGSSY